MDTDRKIYRLTLSTADMHAFLGECEASAWRAVDTGERILTDEGPDAEAVLLVQPHALAISRAAAPLAH